jgi:hypothetical protein
MMGLIAACNAGTRPDIREKRNTMAEQNPADDYLAREAVAAEIDRAYRKSRAEGDATLNAHYSAGDRDLKQHLLGYVWKLALAGRTAGEAQPFASFLAEKAASETDFLQAQAVRFCLETPVYAFSPLAREAIATTKLSGPNAAALTRLVGYLRLTARTRELQGLAADSQTLNSPLRDGAGMPWAARLSLARMGDDAMLDRVIEQVQREKDTIVRATKLFPDLAFTRRSRAMDELRRQLDSVERLPSLRPGDVGMPVAGYAAEALCSAVQGSPDMISGATPDAIAKVQAWAASVTDWQMRP